MPSSYLHIGPIALLLVALASPLLAQVDNNAGIDPADAPPVIELPAADPVPPTVQQTAIPTKNLLDVIRDGGVLMYPIGLCSFVLCVIVFERAIMLRRGRVIPRPFVKRFLKQLADGELDRDQALELCAKNSSPVSVVFAGALKKWGRPSVEVEQAILDAGERVTNNLRRYLRMLNGISTVSPLLGLLGTVFGMIESFNTIAAADAMGKSELLAGGISVALLTTAAGLSVAIPALIAYLFFIGRVDSLIMEIDALGQELVDVISAEAQSERKGARKTRGNAA
jgi:biopolymer transport protein ExbB